MKVLAAVLSLLIAPTAFALPEPRVCPQEERLDEPNFDAYFPDDPSGGKALDLYHGRRPRPSLEDDAYVALVRSGLRRTTTRKLFILREFGNRFIWGKSPQRADALELMFHAADPRPGADKYGTRSSAVYFGLSVAHEKTPRILDALVAVAMASESASTIGRIAWGTSNVQDEMISRLNVSLESGDPKVREKAKDLVKIFRKEESARQRSRRLAIAKAHAEYAGEIPGIRAALRGGTTAARRVALDRLWETSLIMIMDKSAIADFEAAATDLDPGVRRDVVRIVGGEWIWSGAKQHEPSIALMLRMSRDQDSQVQYDSVYYGLSTVQESRRDVVERMLEMLDEPRIRDLHGRLNWGLSRHKVMVEEILLAILRSDTADQSAKVSAHARYRDILGTAPPVRVPGIMTAEDLVGTWTLNMHFPNGRTGAGELTIASKEDGYVISSGIGMGLDPTRLLVTQRGSAISAGAEFEGDNKGFVVTMTLSDGNLDGIWMHSHQRLLMPFTGTKGTK